MNFGPPLIVDVALIILGVLVLVAGLAPSPAGAPATYDPARERAQLVRQLGLAHRLAARLIASRLRPADENFDEAAELFILSGGTSTVAVGLRAYAAPALPLLEVEQLLERMESFSARVRAWRPRGRARGRR